MSMRVTPAKHKLAFTGIKYNELGNKVNKELGERLLKDTELAKLVGKTKIEVNHEFSGAYSVIKKGFLGLFNKDAYVYESKGTFENIADAIKGLLTKKK